jgi:hypothetical protein
VRDPPRDPHMTFRHIQRDIRVLKDTVLETEWQLSTIIKTPAPLEASMK